LIAKQDAFSAVLQTADHTSQVFASFLAENSDRMISIVDTSSHIYPLLAEYSPSLGCVFNALVTLNDLASSAIVNHQIQLSAQLYVPPPGLGQYSLADKPKYITGFGPNCMGLPNPPIPFKVPDHYRCVTDGAALTTDPCSQHPSSSVADQQAVGSQAEDAMVNILISGSEHTTPDRVPPIATVLAAPALRGSEVGFK
jgi:phospholipid/cholesterol/gamma-HCH transport system substrate-binding protein